ncbi:unnamed protein product [Camellia sinensis]
MLLRYKLHGFVDLNYEWVFYMPNFCIRLCQEYDLGPRPFEYNAGLKAV